MTKKFLHLYEPQKISFEIKIAIAFRILICILEYTNIQEIQMSDEVKIGQIPNVECFYDQASSAFSYVVCDPITKDCAIIDSVLGFDIDNGRSDFTGADAIIAFIVANHLKVEWIIETHIHADHVSAAQYIKSKLGGKIAVSEKVTTIQSVFGNIFNAEKDFARDGSQFDHLFKDNETYKIGSIDAKAMLTPGHTPACMTHVIGDAVFVGDTIFMPDVGTARADFPGGNANELYKSIKKIFSLPSYSRLFMCHDYPNDGRPMAFLSNINEQRKKNIHVNDNIDENGFIQMREARDKTLNLPKQILPSVQVNMRAGEFPKKESNGVSYIKIPINQF